MKKVFLSLAVAAALMAGASMANAQEDEAPAPVRRAQVAFVDANGDGICDNIGTRVGTGVGRGAGGSGQGRWAGKGPNFVDANGDGVCDNAGTRAGTGQGQPQMKKDGNGPHGQGRRGNGGRR